LFATNVPNTNPALGVPHASEINFGKISVTFTKHFPDFKRNQLPVIDMTPLSVYGNYAEADVTSDLGNTSLTMMNAWINFAWTLDPNGANGKDSIPILSRRLLAWPTYQSLIMT
jgi:hypothetical protein